MQYLGCACLGREGTWVCTFLNLSFFIPLTSGGPVIIWGKNNQLDGCKILWLPVMTLLYQPHSCWGVSFPSTEGWGGQEGCAALRPISQDHMESLWRCFHGMTGQSCGWPALVLVVVLLQLLGWARDHQNSPPTDMSVNLWHLFCWKTKQTVNQSCK